MNKIALSIVAAAAMTLSSGAFAQGYIGIGAGPSHLSADCTGLTSCDNSGNGLKVFGGYKFAPTWGAELGYYDFGKAKATLVSGGSTVNAEIKTSAVGLGVAFFGDFTPSWKGVARLGVARVKADVSGSAGGLNASDSESSTQAYFGLGVGYMVSKGLTIDGAVDMSKSRYGGDSGSVRLLSIGLTYAF